MSDSRSYRGKRYEEVLRGYPGIYKVLIWDEKAGKYVDPRSRPTKRQKPFRAKKRVTQLGKSVQISGFFDTIEEAKAWRMQTDTPVEPKASPYTLGELIRDWRNWARFPRIQESTFEMYGKDLPHLAPLSAVPVEKLEAGDIDRWLAFVSSPSYPKKASRSSFQRELKVLGTILSWYREYKNPLYRSPILKRHRKDAVFRPVAFKERRAMTWEELERFLATLRGQRVPVYYHLASFQAFTGVRIGEACGLKWDCIDLNNRQATIKRIVWWNFRTKQPMLREGTKTGELRRVVLCDRLVELLKAWRETSGGEGLVFERKGEPLHYPAVQNAFNRAFEASAVAFRSTHILRHTFATLFASQTGNREALRTLLGHRSHAMTDRYAHLVDETQVEAMKYFIAGKSALGVAKSGENPELSRNGPQVGRVAENLSVISSS